jgi:hypothetical protein
MPGTEGGSSNCLLDDMVCALLKVDGNGQAKIACKFVTSPARRTLTKDEFRTKANHGVTDTGL